MAMNSKVLEAQLPYKRLRELLLYDPETGEFTWLKSTSNRVKVGSRAGCISEKRRKPYLVLGIDGRLYHAHRVVWFYMTRDWAEEIDHRDGDTLNNRWDNLRRSTHRENSFNTKRRTDNSSGVKGVSFHSGRAKPYQAWLNGKYLGSYTALQEAEAARTLVAKKVHGDFYRE